MTNSPRHHGRRGVVAVIRRDDRLLIIRRAPGIEAPGTYCFPGGAVEKDESEAAALRRELEEELGVLVTPLKTLWRSTTPWQVQLSWWLARLDPAAELHPNPREVSEVLWLTPQEMAALPQLLISNHHFLQALARGVFQLAE
jgi:8-oxo-dGTP diphosphatase